MVIAALVTGWRNRTATRPLRAAVAALAALALLAGPVALPTVQGLLLDGERDEAEATLRLVANGVERTLRRFDPLPALIADRPVLTALLREPGNSGLVPFVNETLRQVARSVGASDVYLMDVEGRTLAASNYRLPRSYLAGDFAHQPHFTGARSGRAARHHVAGSRSGTQGLLFAAPVTDGIEVAGVVAVRATVDELERAWTGLGPAVLVADADGVIFMSSRSDWRLRTLEPLEAEALERIRRTRRYPIDALRPLDISGAIALTGTARIEIATHGVEEAFAAESRPLSLPGWQAVVLTPIGPVRGQAILAVTVWTLGVGILGTSGLLLMVRRAQLAERLRTQAAAREELEREVAARTRELAEANVELAREVEERRAAEEKLRRTQKELVQAGKLAALGHMSAALSHEINQPLAAVKSYAENAASYLDRGRAGEARENVSLISQMADRMARISGHLRNFARRSGDGLGAIPVGQVAARAVALVEPRARREGVRIAYDPPRPDPFAVGGPLRLEQVLVNVLSNALDAVRGSAEKRIEVAVEEGEEMVRVLVRDTGPGLAEGAEEQAFEPFFTTKVAGEGMGLGLSISYNIMEDFGGRIEAADAPGGGAVFTVSLRRAPADAGAPAS